MHPWCFAKQNREIDFKELETAKCIEKTKITHRWRSRKKLVGKNSRTAWNFPLHSFPPETFFPMMCPFHYLPSEEGAFQLSGNTFLHIPGSEGLWDISCLYCVQSRCQKTSDLGCSLPEMHGRLFSISACQMQVETQACKNIMLPLSSHPVHQQNQGGRTRPTTLMICPLLLYVWPHLGRQWYIWCFISCAENITTPAWDLWTNINLLSMEKCSPDEGLASWVLQEIGK